MNIEIAHPSKYLKASDLDGRTVKVTIDRVDMEEVGQGEDQQDKPVLYFQGKAKGIVLNVTNSQAISADYGVETDDWNGKPLEVYPDRVAFRGALVPCIRVRVPQVQPPAAVEDLPF